MIQQARDKVKKHIKTHSEHSVEDRAAISLLGTFLNPGGRINTSFAANDTWPNHDGTFEFISNPDVSRRPKQNFFVQIKGTSVYTEKDGIIKYSLKSLAFPAYICDNVSFDPGILFVVLDPDQRGSQRVFWKYMSVDFINSINFDQDSMTIAFSANEEILNTDESVAAFCEKLEMIIDQHSFINQLDSRNYTRRDVEGIIAVCDTEITESIERLDIFNDTRDGVSRRILRRLDDLCSAALLLNAIDAGIDTPTLPLAWERSLLNIETKYLGTFLKGLQYIGKRIPDEGQSERLMLKYYEFLWQIRKSLKEINYISNLMANQRKLFLTKTHTALQNLKRRIDNPGTNFDFISIDSFTKQVNLPDYDVIFVDECSTIDNRTMGRFLSKMSPDTFLVLAGDIHQIESIEFGNWFFYAKDIIKTPGANVELLSTWRTQDQALISLWNEVRTRADMITEKLVINGPYSEDIGPNVFKRECEDEVILCLNYDGKFGLNNMNNYFQAANTKGEAIPWAEWSYKVGDPILFNDSKRFDLLYNNLKGRIVDIEKHSGSISFTVDVEIPLTELMCKRDGIEFIESIENGTRIRFAVYEYDESKKGEDLDENLRLKSVVPFQLAYAVSIHKAQGLEYDSVKVIIPSNNAEKITHGIFYTAITRAKTNLKIYWSSETMHDVVKGFATDESKRKSLEIVKTKLGKN